MKIKKRRKWTGFKIRLPVCKEASTVFVQIQQQMLLTNSLFKYIEVRFILLILNCIKNLPVLLNNDYNESKLHAPDTKLLRRITVCKPFPGFH